MSKTLIILNPHAAGGRAGLLWKQLEPLLWQELGELVVAVTERPEEVAKHLDEAYACGLTRVVSVGGDGTNHALVNALAQHNQRNPTIPPMVYGSFPIGTGLDWARGLGMPSNDLKAAARWIAHATPQPTDVGSVSFDDQREYFLNVASAGLGGEVARRINASATRRPWTFLWSTVRTLLDYTPPEMRVWLDGSLWYEGRAYAAAVANGTTFGHGMKIAPDAKFRDGLFDVVLVEGVSRFTVLTALQRVYRATHLSHPAVRSARASEVRIESPHGAALDLELDGEHTAGRSLTFRMHPGLLDILS